MERLLKLKHTSKRSVSSTNETQVQNERICKKEAQVQQDYKEIEAQVLKGAFAKS